MRSCHANNNKKKIETLIVVVSSRASVSIVFSERAVVSCAGSLPVVRVASVRKHSGSEPTKRSPYRPPPGIATGVIIFGRVGTTSPARFTSTLPIF